MDMGLLTFCGYLLNSKWWILSFTRIFWYCIIGTGAIVRFLYNKIQAGTGTGTRIVQSNIANSGA